MNLEVKILEMKKRKKNIDYKFSMKLTLCF